MRPRERRESGERNLFRSRLDQVIDMDHALVKLARTIDWRFLEEKFGAVDADGSGRPPAWESGRMLDQDGRSPESTFKRSACKDQSCVLCISQNLCLAFRSASRSL